MLESAAFSNNVCGESVYAHLVLVLPETPYAFLTFLPGPGTERFPIPDVGARGDRHAAGRLNKAKRNVEDLSGARKRFEQREQVAPFGVAFVNDLSSPIKT